MKKLLFLFHVFCIGTGVHFLTAQPVSLKPEITIDSLTIAENFAVRLEFDSISNSLYYFTFWGDIYKVIQEPGIPVHDSLIASEAQHGINFLQGFVLKDSMMFVCGNYKLVNTSGYGIIACGVLQPNGSRLWHNVLTTAPYPSSATLYDHAFSSILFNPAGDSLLFGSGSRTDHGEVQSKNGQYPDTRDVPLTTKIFSIPANSTGFFLPNSEAALDSLGVIYARGVRNTFDMCFDANGFLFGTENSGDRDDPDELNWIRRGHHYGFPWEMGGNQTPMQFAGYDSAADLMINHNCLGWQEGYFYNDPAYPQKPNGLTITQPVRNYGPDADKYRNPLTGTVQDASDLGGFTSSFTPHRSPLGLVFDKPGLIGGDYTGHGFVLSYTKGTQDPSGTVQDINGNTIGPFADLSEDLLHLELTYDTALQNFNMTTSKIVTGFLSPVDALLCGKKMYVLESGQNSQSVIRIVNFPGQEASFSVNDSSVCQGTTVTFTDNTPGPKTNRYWSFPGGNPSSSSDSLVTVSYPSSGNYDVSLTLTKTDGIHMNIKKQHITIKPLPGASISAGGPLSFCTGGSVLLTANTASGLTYKWKKNGDVITGSDSSRLVTGSGNYLCKVTGAGGCSSLSNILTVTEYPKPDAAIYANGPLSFCPGGNVTLFAPTGAGFVYKWRKNGSAIPGEVDSICQVNATGVYSCKLTDGNGCSNFSNNLLVQVNTPTANTIIPGAKQFCSGDSTLIQANTGTGLTYQWLRNGNTINGATDSFYYPKKTGFYKVIVTNNCGTATSVPKSITVHALPQAFITADGPVTFCTGSQVTLNASTSPGYLYKWKKNNSPVPGAVNSTFVANTTGNYKVKITDINGCTAHSNSIVVTVNCKNAEVTGEPGFTIQPNPFSGNFRILFDHPSILPSSIDIITMTGSTVFSDALNNAGRVYETGEQLAPGVYMLKIKQGQEIAYRRVVRIR